MSSPAKTELISVRYEVEERSKLLKNVSVTERGIAVSEHPITGAVMQLAAVRISDGDTAQHIPFEKTNGKVQLGLPEDKPSQLGFFIGYAGNRQLNGVLRVGEYPGESLITTQRAGNPHEALLKLAGIKANELDEAQWADQIGLFDSLDFDRTRTRGIFSKVHNESGSDTWTAQRIVVVPQSMDDLLETVGPDVRGDTYQVLGYETAVLPPRMPHRPSFDSFSVDRFGMSGDDTPQTMGGGFTTGFGRSFETSARLGAVSIVGLQGALEVTIVPERS